MHLLVVIYMNMKTSFRLPPALVAILLIAFAAAPTVHAQIVNDVLNTLETSKVLTQNMALVEKASKALNVSTEQFNQLKSINKVMGDASNIAKYGKSYSVGKLAGIVGQIPGMEGFDVGKILKSNGALDLFSGIPLDQWSKLVKDPNNYYRGMLTSKAIGTVGKSVGLTSRETNYVDWLRRQDKSYVDGVYASKQMADMALDRWLDETEQRKKSMQTLSETVAATAETAGEDTTLVGQAAATAQLTQQTANITALAAAQADEAAAAQAMQLNTGNQLLQKQLDEADMMRRVRAGLDQ